LSALFVREFRERFASSDSGLVVVNSLPVLLNDKRRLSLQQL
jgi:hypothetical protein